MSRKEQQEYLTRLEAENRRLRLKLEQVRCWVECEFLTYKSGPGPYNDSLVYERYDAKADILEEVLYQIKSGE